MRQRRNDGTCSRCQGPRDREGQRYCRACHAAYMRANRPKDAELSDEARRRVRARRHAGVALARGQLLEQPCETPGCERTPEMHHDDYNQPLQVRWLCRPCHQALHEALDA
ncbi:MAG: hypothetical protein KF709_02710 [Gemmatimonadaceae bacterium]|nr:hypothetical protein [Gemmatimonadaceae bacterium]